MAGNLNLSKQSGGVRLSELDRDRGIHLSRSRSNRSLSTPGNDGLHSQRELRGRSSFDTALKRITETQFRDQETSLNPSHTIKKRETLFQRLQQEEKQASIRARKSDDQKRQNENAVSKEIGKGSLGDGDDAKLLTGGFSLVPTQNEAETDHDESSWFELMSQDFETVAENSNTNPAAIEVDMEFIEMLDINLESRTVERVSGMELLGFQELMDPEVTGIDTGEGLMEKLQQALTANSTAQLDKVGEVVLPQIVRGLAALVRGNAASEMRLLLQPADLGEIELRVRAVDGLVRGEILVSSQEIKQLLESQLGRLRSALAEQGFELEGFDVNVASDNQSFGDELTEQRMPLLADASRDGRERDQIRVTTTEEAVPRMFAPANPDSDVDYVA